MESNSSRVSIEIADGVKVLSRADLTDMTTYVLLEQEDWFEPEMAFARRFAATGATMIDVGANHGVYSLAFARRSNDAGRVWAFEPASEPYSLLEGSLRENPFGARVQPVRAGLSSRVGTATLHVSGSSELNSLHKPGSSSEEIVLETLDHAAAGRWGDSSVDFVKLDAEGAEMAILEGARTLLQRHAPVVMFEIRHDRSALNVTLASAVLEAGFSLHRWMPGPACLVPVDHARPLSPFQLNLFGVPPRRTEALAASGMMVPDGGSTEPLTPAPSWAARFATMPFAASMLPAWQRSVQRAAGSAGRRHGQALDRLLAATDPAIPAADRVAHLRRCIESWNVLMDDVPLSASIGLCLSRALAAAGEQHQARTALGRAVDVLARGSDEAFALPFVPPLEEFDRRPVIGNGDQWLQAAISEAHERWTSFSTYFDPQAPDRLLPMADNPNLLPITRRRLALSVLASGGHPSAAVMEPLRRIHAGHRNAPAFDRIARGAYGAA